MSIEYQEITDELYLQDCVAIQKEILEITDIDTFPIAFFNMLIRKEHPIGVLVGCFKTLGKTKSLIGLGIAVADKAEHCAYVPFIGLIKEYQRGICGYKLLLELRKAALKNGFNTIFALFNPMEIHLSKLYTSVGMKVVQYIEEPYKLLGSKGIAPDKVLIKWELQSDHVLNKISRRSLISVTKALADYQITQDSTLNDRELLINHPTNFSQFEEISKNRYDNICLNTKEIIREYINNKKYCITDCLTSNSNNTKKTYFLLSKQD
jgi:predicted GNAT superfamily acetyltransferase